MCSILFHIVPYCSIVFSLVPMFRTCYHFRVLLPLRFISALNASGWLISNHLTPEQIGMNALTSYYLILLWVMDSWERKGRDWWQCCLPKATVMNMLCLVCANGFNRVRTGATRFDLFLIVFKKQLDLFGVGGWCLEGFCWAYAGFIGVLLLL